MANITLYLPDDLKSELDQYSEIRWSEVVRKTLSDKIIELRKMALLKKYVEKEQFTQSDLDWMDKNDWHPVDEKQMNLSFVKTLDSSGKVKKLNRVEEIFR